MTNASGVVRNDSIVYRPFCFNLINGLDRHLDKYWSRLCLGACNKAPSNYLNQRRRIVSYATHFLVSEISKLIQIVSFKKKQFQNSVCKLLTILYRLQWCVCIAQVSATLNFCHDVLYFNNHGLLDNTYKMSRSPWQNAKAPAHSIHMTINIVTPKAYLRGRHCKSAIIMLGVTRVVTSFPWLSVVVRNASFHFRFKLQVIFLGQYCLFSNLLGHQSPIRSSCWWDWTGFGFRS